MTEPLTVEQRARTAAAFVEEQYAFALHPDIGKKIAEMTRAGKRDNTGYVKAFVTAITEAEAIGEQRGMLRAADIAEVGAPDDLQDFAAMMVEELVGTVRQQLNEGKGLTVEDQKHLIEQVAADRKRLFPHQAIARAIREAAESAGGGAG